MLLLLIPVRKSEKEMKRGLFLLGFCVLSTLIHGRSAAFALRKPTATSTSSGTSAVQEKRPGHYTGAGNYFVDCGAAGTNGDGRSASTAWDSLDDVNGHTFSPGDAIHLKRGTECHGLLWPKGSGSASVVIRLTAYGTGPRPMVIAGKDDEEAFKLFDQQYWDVDSINFSGGTLFGVYVSGQTGILHHIHLRNLLVHDVLGADVKHKESGLVIISPGTVHQHFDDVLVEGVTAYHTNQWAGILVGGGNFGEVPEDDWSNHIIVRDSVVHDVYGDGIVLFRVKDGMITNSAAWYTGMQPTETIGTPNAIWTWMCQGCVVRDNEAFLTDSPGVDGGAFDIDYGNTRNSVENNYAHDTQGYCIAVFGAGYVTHDSVVKGNLCINNARSPRLARRQGAIFLWTWNGGVIENLLVEKNTIYWNPPGDFPALLSEGDIRGSQRIFRDNEIYSASPWFLDSNGNMNFLQNHYVTCGSRRAKWSFDNHTYTSFDEYRNGARQDSGSTWKFDSRSPSCLILLQPHRSEPAPDYSGAHGASPLGWVITSEIPASIDAQGLLDAESLGQLVALKNLEMQFRPGGLRVKITLKLKPGITKVPLQNLIHDLGMHGVKATESNGNELSSHPTTRLTAPDGSVAQEWKDLVGPTEIGLAVRKVVGAPLYSQMSEMKESNTER